MQIIQIANIVSPLSRLSVGKPMMAPTSQNMG